MNFRTLKLQKQVAANVKQRGYGPDGLTDTQYAAKQLAIALQEVSEALKLFDLPDSGLPVAVRQLLTPEVKQHLKDWFHDDGYWERVHITQKNGFKLVDELADCAVPLVVAAESALEIDLLVACRDKSSRDIGRGVG